jgi:4'-phosphopantetheinyl transferase EntD
MDLNSLFPSTAAVVTADASMWQTPLCSEEEALITGAIDKRQREFRAGRNAAHSALAQLQAPDSPLLRGERREPLWPDGHLGSIAHCNDLCIAVCAKSSDLLGLGIDVEPLKPLPAGVERYIHTQEEAAFIADNPGSHPQRLIFSAKESLYKCYYPLVRRFFGFQSVTLSIDQEGGRFRYTPSEQCEVAFPSVRFEGRYLIGERHLVTACYLMRE